MTRAMRMTVLIVAAVIVFVGIAALAAIGFVYIAPEKATRWAVASERKRAGLERKEIDLPGGLHYVYLEGGQGEPLMLLHGFGANKDNFVRVARFSSGDRKMAECLGFGADLGNPHRNQT